MKIRGTMELVGKILEARGEVLMWMAGIPLLLLVVFVLRRVTHGEDDKRRRRRDTGSLFAAKTSGTAVAAQRQAPANASRGDRELLQRMMAAFRNDPAFVAAGDDLKLSPQGEEIIEGLKLKEWLAGNMDAMLRKMAAAQPGDGRAALAQALRVILAVTKMDKFAWVFKFLRRDIRYKERELPVELLILLSAVYLRDSYVAGESEG